MLAAPGASAAKNAAFGKPPIISRPPPLGTAFSLGRPTSVHLGFADTIIKPRPVASLHWAQAEHRSPSGPIRSSWQRTDDGGLRVQITLPPNTQATIYLPSDNLAGITEGGLPLSRNEFIRVLPMEPNTSGSKIAVRCGSGTYEFDLADCMSSTSKL